MHSSMGTKEERIADLSGERWTAVELSQRDGDAPGPAAMAMTGDDDHAQEQMTFCAIGVMIPSCQIWRET